MKPKTIRKHLKQIINDLSANPVLFRRDPRRDLTRTRKLSFSDTVSVVLQMEGKSTANEMLNFCCSANASSASALRQRLCNKLSNERTFDLHRIIKAAYFAGGSILEIPPPLFFYRLGSFFRVPLGLKVVFLHTVTAMGIQNKHNKSKWYDNLI